MQRGRPDRPGSSGQEPGTEKCRASGFEAFGLIPNGAKVHVLSGDRILCNPRHPYPLHLIWKSSWRSPQQKEVCSNCWRIYRRGMLQVRPDLSEQEQEAEAGMGEALRRLRFRFGRARSKEGPPLLPFGEKSAAASQVGDL